MAQDEVEREIQRGEINSPLDSTALIVSIPMKRFISASIFYTQFASGCCFTILAPTVIRFSQILDSDVATISVIFTIRTVAYLISALSCGILYNYLNRQMCTIILTGVVASSLFLLPTATTLTTFYGLGALMGLGSACYDTAQIAHIIELWRSQAAPYILTQHFSYSLGTIVTPMLLAPFLDDQVYFTGVHNLQRNFKLGASQSNLFIPFAIAGSLMTLAVIFQLLVFLKVTLWPEEPLSEFSDQAPIINNNEPEPTQNSLEESGRSAAAEKWRQKMLTFLSAMSIGFYSGIELTTMQFLPTFCVYSKLALSEAEGAQILFGLTLAFSIGRLIGIPLVILKTPPEFIVYVNCALMLGSNFVLYMWAPDSLVVLWVGSVILGAGMSTVYPSIYAFIERHLHVTNGVVSTLTVAGGVVSSFYPILVGHFVETNTAILNYVILFSISILFLSFSTLHWTIKKNGGSSGAA